MSQSRSKARESLVHLVGKDLSVHEWNIRPKALAATVSMAELFYWSKRSFRLAGILGGPFSNPLGEAMRPD